MRCAGGGNSRERVDRRGDAAAREIARDARGRRSPRRRCDDARATSRALGAQPRVEALAVDRVVDDGQLRLGEPRTARESRPGPSSICRSRRAATGSRYRRSLDRAADIDRAASTRADRRSDAATRASPAPRARRRGRRRPRGRRRSRACGSCDSTRLGFVAANERHAARAKPQSRQSAADVERIADHRLDQLQARLRPRPRIQRNRDVALEQRFERPLGVALDGAVADGNRCRTIARRIADHDSKYRRVTARDRRDARAPAQSGLTRPPAPAATFPIAGLPAALPVQSIESESRPGPPPSLPPCRSTPSTLPSRRRSLPKRCPTSSASTTRPSSSSTAATR